MRAELQYALSHGTEEKIAVVPDVPNIQARPPLATALIRTTACLASVIGVPKCIRLEPWWWLVCVGPYVGHRLIVAVTIFACITCELVQDLVRAIITMAGPRVQDHRSVWMICIDVLLLPLFFQPGLEPGFEFIPSKVREVGKLILGKPPSTIVPLIESLLPGMVEGTLLMLCSGPIFRTGHEDIASVAAL